MTYDEYSGAVLNNDTGPAALARATRDVDILTFGRTRTVELSDFVQTRVCEVIAALAEWQVQNEVGYDISVFGSHSKNAVTEVLAIMSEVNNASLLDAMTGALHRLLGDAAADFDTLDFADYKVVFIAALALATGREYEETEASFRGDAN